MSKYGTPWYFSDTLYMRYDPTKTLHRLISRLECIGLKCSNNFDLDGQIYDIQCGKNLIQIDDTYSRNSYIDVKKNKIYSEEEIKYHRYLQHVKTSHALERGYRCIHVWDWDNSDKVVYLVQPKKTVYARSCDLERIDKITTDTFLKLYHIQGTCSGQKYSYGMFHDGRLIGVMTFGKPRYSKRYDYELLRLCYDPEYRIIGGSERMFKTFLKSNNPNIIVSYCDKSKFSGDVYSKLGMKVTSDGKPARHWYSADNRERMKHITNNFLLQRGYDQIFNEHYGKGTDNVELILNRGYLPIYDCGQVTFVWTKDVI